jgi:hypothetical protein
MKVAIALSQYSGAAFSGPPFPSDKLRPLKHLLVLGDPVVVADDHCSFDLETNVVSLGEHRGDVSTEELGLSRSGTGYLETIAR